MRLQVAISPRVEARLDEMLGHPEICPHGNPIDAATAKRRPTGVRLSEMEAGTHATVYRITEEAEEDAGLLSYLEARALKPGAPVTILARSESLDSLTLDGPRGRATLGLRRRRSSGCIPARRTGAVPHGPRPMTTRVRIAPSPTGPLHIGTARTALYNFLHARHVAGRSSCGWRTRTGRGARSSSRRTSSTACTGSGSTGTRARRWPASRRGAARPVSADGAAAVVRGRGAASAGARSCLSLLLHAGGARSRPAGPGGSQAAAALRRSMRPSHRRGAPRPGVTGPRGALPGRRGPSPSTTSIRGRVEIDVANLGGDFVIVRADGTPLYHFTVVVDDAAMEVTDVIRGEDHLSNTPKHILLFRAPGYEVPRSRTCR